MNKLLIICGPTATGKTKLAIRLAKKFKGELVSADSRQVYKGLDALTGKNRSEDIPIWLYDVVEPIDEFSVAHFVRLAKAAIRDIHTRGKLPIMVGGTGFYLRALTRQVDTIVIPPNKELRKRLNGKSVDMLGEELRRVDTIRWNTINDSDRANPRRLIRAIEVARSKKPTPSTAPRYDALWIGLWAPLSILRKRITLRVAARFAKAVTEVRANLPAILGADPLLLFLRGQSTKEEAMKKWADAEYSYARRQMTWFRKEAAIHWFDIVDTGFPQKVEELVKQWYTPARA